MKYEQRRDLRYVRVRHSELTGAAPHRFPKRGERLDAPTEMGVYIIFSPQGRVLHVGSTPHAKKGIAQRLKDHLAGRSSFTQKHFKGPKKKRGSQLRGTHTFRCLPVPNGKLRARLEAYAIGILCPEHIGHGEDQPKR